MKKLLNPMIEVAATRLIGVDQYADIFEKLATAPALPTLVRRAFGRKIARDISESPLLFIHVPKNGGTSIKRALYRSDPGHATVRLYALLAPHLLEKTSLAILREPVDRFLSGFDFLINRGGSDVSIQPGPLRRLAHIRSVDDFLDHLEAIGSDWLKVDTFARPQWWYLADRDGVIRIRHLWLLGAQNEALGAFLDGHGVGALPHANRTDRATRTVTMAQEARLRALYAPDFALYEQARDAGDASTQLAGRNLADLASSA